MASELECNLRDTVDWGRTQPVKFDRCNNTGAIDFKIDRPVLKENISYVIFCHGTIIQNISFKVMPFSTKLGWGSYMISFAKTASKRIGVLIGSVTFLPPEVALYHYESTIRPCMEYYRDVWTVAPGCYLEMLDNPQKTGV